MKLGAEGLFNNVKEAYKNWKSSQPVKEQLESNSDEIEISIDNKHQEANLEQLEEQALSQLEDHIRKLNPYEFQDLVAALLRGMGYYTPFIAPKGKDNGIDVIAYKDPIGIEKPTIKVQVKHYPDNPIQSQDIQKLKGALAHDEEVGIFVTSGRFSPNAIREARTSKSHIEIIDFTRLMDLWKSFYNKLSDEDKSLLPLHPIYFLGAKD